MRQILTLFKNRLPAKAGSGTIAGLLIATVLIAVTGSSPALSEEIQQTAASPKPVVDCTCRYRGGNYRIGDAICLNGPSGPRMATCDMVLNNTSWSMSETPCPTAGRTPAPISVLRTSWNG